VFREDYLMRQVHQLADAIAHVAGLNRGAEHDQALATADQAWGKLLDAPRALIDAVDPATLAGMLREPAKIRAAARLYHQEAVAWAGTGDPVLAERASHRALALMREAKARDPSHAEEDDDAMIQELSRLASAGPR
jgi:hypothetical protein